jgi:hypothetical protein
LLKDGERVLASGLTLLWLMAFSFTLACSVGNATANRGDTVQLKAEAIEKYETAKANRARLESELQQAKQSQLWETTSARAAVGRRASSIAIHP